MFRKYPFISKNRVITPTILQMEAAECGAAALAIVLGYYGLYLPLEKVRSECGVSRDGSNALNIVRAARRFGMEAKGQTEKLETLNSITLPVILHWNFNHFVVLEGMERDNVYINDPAFGRRTIHIDELNRSFTGIILEIRPGESFSPAGSKTTFRETLSPILQNEHRPILFLIIAGFAMLIPAITLPMVSRIFFDEVLTDRHILMLSSLLYFMAIFVGIQAVVSWIRGICLERWEIDLSYRLSKSFFLTILFLPISFFDQRYAGEISSRVGLNDQVANLICGKAAGTVLDIFASGIYLCILFLFNIQLTVIACLVILINILYLNWASKHLIDQSRRLLVDKGKLFGLTMSGVLNIESIKASANESDFFKKWAGNHARYINNEQALMTQTAFLSIIPVFINGMGSLAILTAGIFMVMNETITAGTYFAYMALFITFLLPIQRLVMFGGELAQLDGSLQRLSDVKKNVNKPPDLLQEKNILSSEISQTKKLQGLIEFRDVTFGYSPLENPLINAFSLKIKPGSRVALVGSSGCGKSTVAKLLMGLYKPWSGEILIDSIPFDDLPKSRRYLSLSCVSQETVIFEGTVRDNLTLWDKTIPDKDIIQAAKDAEIHELISSLPHGYDHYLQEGGKNLSGGQRQRLEIARALAGNPTIIVLDEATSSLDPVTEDKILHNIRARGCTSLLAAHRLSTIRDCDEIIVIRRGSITEHGTHEHLLNRIGEYYHLITTEKPITVFRGAP